MTALRPTPEELTGILEAHRKWRFGEAGGAGADLARADLADARNVSPGIEPQTAEGQPREPWRRPSAEERQQRRVARAEQYRERNPQVPVIADLDKRILEIVEANPAALEMSRWHTCDTTHCRAGWAITLAGSEGKTLEEKYGPHIAGRMIYLASTGRAPHFFASNQAALEDLRACAAEACPAEPVRP